MAIGPVNNPYLQQILFQNLSSSTIQPNQLKNSVQLLNSVMNAKNNSATISATGSKINNVNTTIRDSGDMQAYEGFQAALQRAGGSSDPLEMVRFVNSANFAANNDQTALNNAFAGIARNMEQNDTALLDGFNKAFTATVENTGLAGLNTFNKAFTSVENADYSGAAVTPAQNLRQLFTTVRQVATAGNSESEALSDLNRLARGIEMSDNADSIFSFFNEFAGLNPTSDFS